MGLGLNKEKVARCFRRSLPTYDEAARIQKELAERLLQSMQFLPDTVFRNVLEIGCGSGILTEMLCREKKVETLFLNDLVPECEGVVSGKLADCQPDCLIPCFGDIENVALPDGLSLVLSGATFQWLDDLPSFLRHLARHLDRGSYLAFSLFGPGTLKEFSSLISVELDYRSDDEVLSILKDDFSIESYKTYQDKLFFPTVRELMQHIRATGVGGVSEYRWTRASLRTFEKAYEREFGGKRGVVVSYASSCFVFRRN